MPDVGPDLVLAAPAGVPDVAVAIGSSPMPTAELPFMWAGNPWSLAGPCVFNALMTVITVGIYNFWGRTEIRRRLWACVRLDGEPLVYHGTGLEMFKGFTAAVLVVLLPIFVLSTALVIVFGQGSQSWMMFQVGLFVVVYPVLKAFATYRARRYRLARTSWRGIRGSVSGSASEFAFLSWATSILTPLTLGWILPWRELYIQRFLTGDTMLGDRKLSLRASAGSLYLRFALLWVGTIALYFVVVAGVVGIVAGQGVRMMSPADWVKVPRLIWIELAGVVLAAGFVWSLISSFYYSSLYNLTASTTVMLLPGADRQGTPVRFKLTTKGRHLVWLFVTNQLLTYASVFVLKPVATARSLRYFTQHLSVVGAFDPATLKQNPNGAIAEGEGLAQAFDFDAF